MGEVSASEQRVFIIHGRNSSAVEQLSRFLRSLGLVPWPFEEVSAELGANPFVGAVVEEGIRRAKIVVALFTPDERAILQRSFYQATDKEHDRRRSQSRPNVFFETGMALALAPASTLMVVAGDVELPSDFGGRLLLRLSNQERPRRQLRDVLDQMGCAMVENDDFLKVEAHGDFSDLALFGKNKPRLLDTDSKQVDLLLGPGGIRCMAFAGAIAALERNGYTIQRIFGISAGALMAAAFAADADVSRLKELIRSGQLLSMIRPPGFWGTIRALWPPFAAHDAIDHSLFSGILGGDPMFHQLKVELGIAALDISTNRLLAYTSESHPRMLVSDALTLSTAVPFFYPWVSAGNRIIVDAAVQTQMPLWLPAAFKTPSGNRVVALSVAIPQPGPPRAAGEYMGRLLEASGAASDHFDVLQSRRLIRIPIPVPQHGFLDKLTTAERTGLVQQGDTTVDAAIASGSFNFPDRAIRTTDNARGDIHDVAQTEAGNASIRYARELQRFSSELDDD